MSKIHLDSVETQEKKGAGNPSPLGRRELLVIAGQAAAAVALAACDGKDTQTGNDMGMGADLRSNSPDLRSTADLRPLPDLKPPIDMTYICMPMVATGAETLAVDEAKSFYDYDYPAKSFIVARDAKGFFALRNVCSHFGCQTGVNAAAKSYDCPCHGSRYNLDGTLLQGPALEPLKSYPLSKRGDGMLVVDPCGPGSTDLSERIT
jgi:Rieske Fe-S protein